MEKGILTSEQEKQIAEMLDDAVKVKGLWEFVDGIFFKMVVTFVDDMLVDKLGDEIKIKLANLVDAVMAKDVELSESLAADIINGLVDIPGLDESSEGLLFKGAIEMIVGAILMKVGEISDTEIRLNLAK
jgi:hypothetical protein